MAQSPDPSSSELYFANADGSGERRFLDQERIPTSWTCSAPFLNGSVIEPLAIPAVGEAAVLSSDGTHFAFCETTG